MSRVSEKCLYACVAIGLCYLAVFAYVSIGRIFFPFEIEWMEGGMVSHAARLMLGQPIYAEPSADFVPFFYTPGYPAVVAALGWLFGDVSLAIARMVSLLAACGTMALLYDVVKRETSAMYGLLAVGVYAALFRTNGAFYDLARPDSLYLFLVFAGVVLLHRKTGHRWAVVGAAIFILAFFTKQTSSVFVPPLILFLLWRNWTEALTFAGVTFAGASLGVWLLNHATDGWFWVYIFEGHQGHLFYWKNILLEYWRDVLFLAPLLLLLPLLWFGYRIPVLGLSLLLMAHWTYAFIFRTQTLDYVPHMYYRELFYESPRWLILIPPALIAGLCLAYRAKNHAREVRRDYGFWLLMYVAGVGASAMNHSTQWAYSNCFMPISLFSAVLIPLVMKSLLEGEETKWGWLLPTALAIQLVAWGYNPQAQMPDEADNAALATLQTRLESIDGPIFFPAHPLTSYHRDGKVHIHQMGIQDVKFMGGVKDLRRRLNRGEWAAVIEDERTRVPGLRPRYYVGERLRYSERDALRAKTGFRVRPHVIWYRQDAKHRELTKGLSANFEADNLIGWTGDTAQFNSTSRISQRQGRQGTACLGSTRRDTGRLMSKPFTLEQPRLTYLLGASGGKGGGLAVRVGGKRVIVRRPPPQKRIQMRRGAIDLSRFLGSEIQLEVFDDDKTGGVYVDDLRLTPL